MLTPFQHHVAEYIKGTYYVHTFMYGLPTGRAKNEECQKRIFRKQNLENNISKLGMRYVQIA